MRQIRLPAFKKHSCHHPINIMLSMEAIKVKPALTFHQAQLTL
ncbi:MAG: hypothetical protein V4722_22230 [Bacteroidota bacterium]